tara:strand:- start:234 stop:659 length:426 start_codon:yes stop_codon:yes gene_type:complete
MTGVAAVAPRVSDRAAEETGIAVAPEFANADRDVRRTTPTSADATDAKHHEGQVESSDSDSNQDGVKRNDEGREHGEGASKKVSWCTRITRTTRITLCESSASSPSRNWRSSRDATARRPEPSIPTSHHDRAGSGYGVERP